MIAPVGVYQGRTYLDHNATAPLRPQARAAMIAAMDVTGNGSSVHAEGRRARGIVEDAREQVAALCGADPANVVFTSGASEANAAVLAGRRWGSITTSCIEHPSLLQASQQPGLLFAADADGKVSIDDDLVPLLMADAGLSNPALVTLQLVNGETGVVQDVARLVEICRRCRPDAVIHTDAVQALGRIPVSFKALSVDAMSISSHKIGGPQGAGALVVRDGLPLEPLVRGGGQERGRRSGTENVAAIAGFGAAAEAALLEIERETKHIADLRYRLEQAVAALTPDAIIVGAGYPRIANTSCIALPGARAETLVIKFDLAGVAISAGAACSSGKVGSNRTLLAMGLSEDVARSAIRVSLGATTTDRDVDRFIDVWSQVHRAGEVRNNKNTNSHPVSSTAARFARAALA